MSGNAILRNTWTRRLLLLLVLVGLIALLWLRGPALYKAGLDSPGSHDFVQYWGAARLLWQGDNPYDPVALLAMEQAVGWPEAEPLLMWNPPWTLALVLPAALLPFAQATVAWFLLQLAIILGSGLLLWRYFAPGDRRYWIGAVLAAAYVPGLFALGIGQISPWLLAGIVGFLCAERARRDLLAGSALALLMIKPHITYLFWLAALWWVLHTRRWRILAGWFGALLIASGVVLLLDSNLLMEYLMAMTRPPLDWAPPTLGAWLRLLSLYVSGADQRWLQFLPSLVGGILLVAWLLRQRKPWRWERVASPLLLGSMLTAAYGWTFDQVVLLPVVVDLFSRLRASGRSVRAVAILVLVLSQLALAAFNGLGVGEFFLVWHVPFLAGLYWWGARQVREPRRDDWRDDE